jgi:FtsZ-binding cell division protein ZapB
MRINLLSDEFKKKADKTELQLAINGINEHVNTGLEKCEQTLQSARDDLSKEINKLRSDFEYFKSKDFSDIVARVSALEKKM